MEEFWLEAWFGEAFCAAVIRDLRKLVASYLPPSVPRFNRCSDGLTISTDALTVAVDKGASPIWRAALSQTTVEQLNLPQWSLLVGLHSSTTFLEAIVGVATDLEEPGHARSGYPAKGIIAVTTFGRTFNTSDQGMNVTKIPEFDLTRGQSQLEIRITCHLASASIYLTLNGTPCQTPLAIHVKHLARFYPYVELLSPDSFATFGP